MPNALSIAVNPAVYLVGGAVRDALLGQPVQDCDFVVVGCEPQDLLEEGFTAVGKDFPVFLHPTTHDQVALARTERKTAAGYHGFAFHAAPDVRIEDDLSRRDLTINAIAIQVELLGAGTEARQDFSAKKWIETVRNTDWAGRVQGALLTDPFGGLDDLKQNVLRHVTEAFAEDPVRVLRLARFAARFSGFTVAPETQALMSRMVQSGEVDALVAERVWQEFSRGLMTTQPSRMLSVLRECGALARVAPEVAVQDPIAGRCVDLAAQDGAELDVRFAALCHTMTREEVGSLSDRWKVPQALRELAELASAEHTAIWSSAELDAAELVQLLQRSDAFRRPERFERLVFACGLAASATEGALFDTARRHRLLRAASKAQAVNARNIAKEIESQAAAASSPSGDAHPMQGARISGNLGRRIQSAIAEARIIAVQSQIDA